MHQRLFITILLLGTTIYSFCQPKYSTDIQKEKLGRGAVIIQDGDSVALSWRMLETDKAKSSYNIFKNGVKINSKPISNATFFKTLAPEDGTKFEIRSTGKDGVKETLVYHAGTKDYIRILLSKPADGMTPDGRRYGYSANDASVGDVDGDGEYEIILKWDPTNSHDNSHEGFTGNTIFDCYKIPTSNAQQTDNLLLWRINLGKNIRAGAHYSPFLVYDFDGDGKAELIVKTADGTIDGQGNVIGDANANWVTDGMIEKSIDGKATPTKVKVQGRILDGPEYLTVFDGPTGKALKTVDYIPPRNYVSSWGDTYGNRSERYLAAVAYLDGKHPSAVMCRGYYTQSYLAAYDWDGKDLTLRWLFDSTKEDGYSGQGNHNLRVGDVDGDGCDEITYGSMAVDHTGKGLYTTKMGHGDAMHQYAFFPNSNELQIWDVHENKRDGSDFRDAKTGKIIFQIKDRSDVGRGMAADIDPTNWGLEMWSASQKGYFDVKGNHHAKESRIPQNSAVWWDGDLLRELLDGNSITKWNWNTQGVDLLKDFRSEGCTFNNGTKQNPCLSADIIGDWREEVVVRSFDSSELRIYSTTIPTQYCYPTFMQDIPYRISVATENVGYNQPPEPGFYFGSDTKK